MMISISKPFVNSAPSVDWRSLSTALSKSHTAAIVPKDCHSAPKYCQKIETP